tara:strand:+ start:336 stop:509 length:174 start_codon:yes stop_codon:yes gene_type:complete
MRSKQEKLMKLIDTEQYTIWWKSYRSAISEGYTQDKACKHADECLKFYKDMKQNLGA